jgi:16S rRNA (uracil1498-N3)-methyltransferase
VVRRIHVHHLAPGEVQLAPAEAHHARDVLRLAEGTSVELFDDAGQAAAGIVTSVGPQGMTVRVETVTRGEDGLNLTIAAAVPKGDRADWMVEKLGELGVQNFIPLATARSVVLPAGKNKTQRWARLAIESAKQSRRVGVMRIAELTPLDQAIRSTAAGWYLSTRADALPISRQLKQPIPTPALTLFIGPEGGWTNEEITAFDAARFTDVGLTRTILRVETAAIAAAAMIACRD